MEQVPELRAKFCLKSILLFNSESYTFNLSMRHLTTLLFCFLTSITCSIAQELLTMEQAVQKTLLNNYGIQIAKNDLKQSKDRITRGNAGQLPSVSAAANYGAELSQANTVFFEQDPVSRTARASNLAANINLNYTVFDGMGMFYRYDLLKKRNELQSLNTKQEIENTISQMIATYLNALSYQQAYLSNQEAVNFSIERFDRSKKLLELGMTTQLALLSAQVDLASDSSAMLNSILQWNESKKNLAYLLGRENSDFELDQELDISTNLKLQTIKESAKIHNTLMQQAEQNIAISGLDYKIYQAAQLPVVSLYTRYGYNRNENDLAVVLFNERNTLSGGVNINFGIFNGGQRKNEIQIAKINLEKRELQKEDVNALVKRDIEVAYVTYETRLELQRIESRNLENAELNFQNSKKSYDLGLINSVELRQAQVNLINVKNRINETKLQAKKAEVELLRLAGLLLE